MRKSLKLIVGGVLSALSITAHAEVTSDRYFSVGYTQSDAEATTTYGPNTEFDTFTSVTLGFSTKLFDKYNIGLVVDLEEMENMNLLFGTENSRFRIRTNTVRGQLNGQSFEFDETSYLWYLYDPYYSWGIVYGDYQTLGQHDSYSPPTGSNFIPINVNYVGWVRVSDAFGNKKTGWGAEGITGFVFLNYTPDNSVPLSDSSGLGLYLDMKLGYYKNFGRYEEKSGKAVLFMGVNMAMTMDFTSEYSMPWSLGPSLTFSTKW